MDNIGLRREMHPLKQFLLLMIYILGGSILLVFLMLALGLGVNPAINDQTLWKFRLLQTASSAAIFLLPAIALAYTERQRPSGFYGFKAPRINLLGIVLLLMVVSMPFMAWTVSLNESMSLPEALKPLEKWMRDTEAKAMEQTYLLLKMRTVTELLINILMIAILPGICEELLFRGSIQRIFGRIFSNKHIVIWSAAIIFSAIHLQFLGFLPRMLLGAGFGYLYFWSGSLWYPIFGHFLNNAYAVFMGWSIQKQNLPLSEADKNPEMPWYVYLISFALTMSVFYLFKNKVRENE